MELLNVGTELYSQENFQLLIVYKSFYELLDLLFLLKNYNYHCCCCCCCCLVARARAACLAGVTVPVSPRRGMARFVAGAAQRVSGWNGKGSEAGEKEGMPSEGQGG